MAFCFRRKESASKGVRRIMREESANVVSLLADHGNDVPERIHEARLGVKRLRAVLRLVRSEMDGDVATTADVALREAGRRLSLARDADATLEIFERLARKLKDPALANIRAQLVSAIAGNRKRALSRNALDKVAGSIREAVQSLTLSALAAEDWQLLRSGLIESYTDARRARKAAKHDPTSEMLHEWRKLVKVVTFQLQLPLRTLAKREKKQLQRLQKLGALLGVANDLDLLEAALATLRKTGTFPAPALDLAIASAMGKTRSRIFKVAREAFAARPRDYTATLRAAWKRLLRGKA